MSAVGKPKLFLYSFAVPVLWIIATIFLSVVLPSRKLGLLGTALVLQLIIILITWRLVKKYNRAFSEAESIRLVIYCAAWMVGLQLLSVLMGVLYAQSQGIGLNTIGLLDVALSSAIYVLFIWLGMKYVSPKFAGWYIAKGVG